MHVGQGQQLFATCGKLWQLAATCGNMHVGQGQQLVGAWPVVEISRGGLAILPLGPMRDRLQLFGTFANQVTYNDSDFSHREKNLQNHMIENHILPQGPAYDGLLLNHDSRANEN